MLITPFIISKLVDSLKILEGTEIVNIFRNDNNSINFQFDEGEELTEIEFREVKNEVGLFIKNQFSSRQLNRNIFNRILGEIVQNIYQLNFDRVIVFDLIGYKLVFLLFGRGKSDILISEHNFNILESLNSIYKPIQNLKEILNLTNIENKNLSLDIKSVNNEYLNNKINHEKFNYKWLFYNNINYNLFKYIYLENQKGNNNLNQEIPTNTDNEFITKFYLDFQTSIKSCNNYILFKQNDEYCITFDINNYSNYINEFKFDSENTHFEFIKNSENLSYLLSFAIYKSIKESELNELKQTLLKPLERIFHKNKSLLKEYTNGINLIQLAETYKNYGDILMSQPNLKIRVGKEIKTFDFEGNEINIELDPKLLLIENAEKYYKKYYKTKKDYQRRVDDLPKLEYKVKSIENIITKLNNIKDTKEYKKIEIELVESKIVNIKDLKINMKETSIPDKLKIELKFRKFELSDNYTLYVGKDSKNNDELTMKFAKSNDVWLHAKGVGGSHCVIKNNSSNYPPKHIIEEAAEISAYFSQARNGGFVPVIYTFKKFVHKPKGAAHGSVTVKKEDVIMVKPREPKKQ